MQHVLNADIAAAALASHLDRRAADARRREWIARALDAGDLAPKREPSSSPEFADEARR